MSTPTAADCAALPMYQFCRGCDVWTYVEVRVLGYSSKLTANVEATQSQGAKARFCPFCGTKLYKPGKPEEIS